MQMQGPLFYNVDRVVCLQISKMQMRGPAFYNFDDVVFSVDFKYADSKEHKYDWVRAAVMGVLINCLSNNARYYNSY